MLAKQRLNIKLTLALMLAVVAVLVVGVNSMAQSEDSQNTSNSLRVSPVRSDITMDPGETDTVAVTVTNPADFDVVIRPAQNDFVASGEDGSPALILEEDEFAPKYSLKRFMQPLENVTVGANESRTINVEIRVPDDASAGGYFGALRLVPVSTEDGGQVNLNASVASLILLRVSGDAPEELSLTDFDIKQNDQVGGVFFDSEDIEAMVRFQNDGAVQLGPIGTISVTKGDEVVYQTDFNNKDQRDVILPESARRWNIPLNDINGFGNYTVSAIFTYGSNNQTVEVTKSFWVIPWAFIIGAVVALVLVIVGIYAALRSRAKRKSKMSLGR